ncbi:Flp pilus assembly protein TadD [Bhargavaea cecembensis DSE10]|uniref:Flp pilus assembly protein TadD n=1 Tax=Bhargavaea cecembensis DSE10 TaxID=1235279 RepID=M7P4Q1_9BACL|nr:tetratricopeptide repeat protein [Bhargavaea cecembensis]EMR05509.1 Flp pilus assembly protein TadD [Bhargavaea cecembensis DSE10]
MREEIGKAVRLRKEGRLKESNALLVELAEKHPDDPEVRYQAAWSFDVIGEEASAVPHYEKAIQRGLSGKDREGAYLGLGSTYRTLGEYVKSDRVFCRGREEFPENRALQVFHAMTLHNLGHHAAAMELLLVNLADATSDPGIRDYGKAIRFYADKLDQTWT